MRSKVKFLIKNTLVFALGNIGSKIILFLLVPLYTNCLSEAQYGIADLVFTVSQLLIPIVSLVIFDAVIRFGLERHEQPQNVLLTGMIVWLLGSAVTLVLLPLIGSYQPIKEWLWQLYLYVVVNILLSVELNYLKAKGENMAYSVICIVQTAVMAGLNILTLVVWKMDVAGYLISNNLACVVAAAAAFVAGKLWKDLKIARFEPALFRSMIRYSAPLVFNNLAWWIIQSSDKIMIEWMVGAAALGLYTVAARIPSLINVFVTIFQQAWGISSVVEMDSGNDKNFYGDVLKYFVCLILLGCMALNAIIRPFMKIYVGPDFGSSWQYVPLLVAAAAFSAFAAYFGSLYGALKKSVNSMASTMMAAAVNFAINMLLIPVIGVWGAVAGTVVAYIALAVYRMADVLRFVKIPVDYLRIVVSCALMLAQAVLVSLNWHIYAVSFVALAVFAVLNFRLLRGAVNDILKKS